MTTTYTLHFWSRTCDRGEIRRVYVNASDRSTLGFFEERIGSERRGTDTYYDRHRVAKGDTVAETGRTYMTTVPPAAVAAIYAALNVPAEYQGTAASDDFARFDALVHHARGIDRWFNHPARSAAGRAERKRAAEQAAFSIDL